MTIPSSYDWIRPISPNLKKIDSIPLTGATPSFPWDDFSARLGRSFDCEDLSIQPGEITWRTKEDLYTGLSDTLFPLAISIHPIQGQVSWVMPIQEVSLLTALLLTKDFYPLSFQDSTLNESFCRFLALEALYHFTRVSFDKTLSPILANQTNLPNQDSLCWDISICIKNHTIVARLIISPEFRQSWVEYFAQKQESSPLTQQMAKIADVIVHLEAGKTQLTLAEWMSVKIGDFIILDSCSLNSELLNGRVMLTIHGKQVFRAKLKDGSLKILELPLLQEVQMPMAKQFEDEDEDEDELNHSDLSEDEVELNDEDENESSDEDLFSDNDDDLFDEESEEEGETETKQSSKELPSQKEQSVANESPTPTTEIKHTLINPEQIPITLIIEVGQVQMTMEQLLKLEPGNLLDINIQPQNGVDLTINGKVVGKGELIRLGDSIGVRVLQLGR